jgi:HEAT repeat protein
VDSAIQSLIGRGELSWVLGALAETKAAKLSGAVQTQVAAPETLERVLTKEPLDTTALDLVLGRIGIDAARPMLNALIASESSHTRRVLLDRLVGLGEPVGELAVQHLDDARWFVQRNMLVILAGLPNRPAGFNAADFLQHADSRVRREAIRMLLAEPDRRERAICHAVADGDARTVRLGLSAAIERCPETAVPLVVSRTTGENPRDIRVLAIKALGASGNRVALETLLKLVAPRRKLFRSKAPPRTPEYLAALAALHQYATHPAARHALAEAAKSSDAEVARVAVGTGPAPEI